MSGKKLINRAFTKAVFFSATIALCVVMDSTCVMAWQYPGGDNFGYGGGGLGIDPLHELIDSLSVAKNERAKQRLLNKIEQTLSTQYDSFLERNELELQNMESRVKRLRDQLERRKQAKHQLLKLELTRIQNEAAGLVWPQNNGQYGSGMGGDDFSPGMGMGGGMGMGMGGMVQGGMGMGKSFMGGPPSGGPDINKNPNVVPAVNSTGKTADQLRAITLACLNYESATRLFPANIVDEDGKALLSWRVAILPYLDDEAQSLYEKFKLDEPWNSEHNVALIAQMPEVFQALGSTPIKTTLLGFDGEGTIFKSKDKVSFSNITDGSSNTILAIHANRQSAIEWTKPADLQFNSGEIITQFYESEDGKVSFSFCDGSVHDVFLEQNRDDLKYLIMRNDGHVIRSMER